MISMRPTSPIFDAHVHVFPDSVGPQAVARMAPRLPFAPAYDGTRHELLARMKQGGISGALNLPVATRSEQVPSINTWAGSLNAWPILSLGAIHPDFPDPEKELLRIKSMGLRGVKLHPEYQAFSPDEHRLDRIWQICRELNLIVFLHAGKDWLFDASCRATPANIGHMVRAWPGLTVVAAHGGGFQRWDEVERELVGLPLYLDTSFVPGYATNEQFLRIVRQHGSSRILFASDAPWQDPVAVCETFLRAPLTPEEQRAILWDNASRLLNFDQPSHSAEVP